jgi:chemotaxis protein methyltransferase CheR
MGNAVATAAAATQDILPEIRMWVETHCGIRFENGQEGFFRMRLDALCRRQGTTLSAVFARLLSGDRDLILQVAEAASTNYTFMFREPEVFEVLGREIFPSLRLDQVRCWSAAASSGEEAYSMAIVAQEVYGASSASKVRVLGTDLSARHVRSAEEAIYTSQHLVDLTPARRALFEPAGLGHFRPHAALRRMCTFRRMNLTQDAWPFEQRFHVTFLRNVLYYFDVPVRRRILEACYDATEPGGWLVTSFTEPVLDLSTRWRQVRPAFFRRDPR